MHALVLADGDAAGRSVLDAAWPGWDDGLAYVVAADGGARHADALGVRIDRWVGDGDSLGEAGLQALIEHGVPVDRAAMDKDESDTELAVLAALRAGATRLTVVGALGGPRVDHALANVALLALDGLVGIDARLLADDARIRLLRAPGAVALDGRTGDTVTLLPWGRTATGVTTAGLRFPLHDAALLVGRTRGLSNVRTSPIATVAVGVGALLVVESPSSA